MKKYTKKIIVGIFTFAFLFTGTQSVFAAAFNGMSGDCHPGIGIGNYSEGNIPRDSQGCWSATSISANAGDTINVAMYYHNTTGSTLTNVRASIVKSSSGPAKTFTFTGTMYSDQGSQTIGTVRLNLSDSQKITYSSTHLMKGASAVENDTDTSVFTNDGGQIAIGSVPTGWDNFGEVLAVFNVGDNYSPTPSDCSISSFTASDTSISDGDSATLRWNTSGCDHVKLSGYSSDLSEDGSKTVSPSDDTTYTLRAYDDNGDLADNDTVKINVDNYVAPIVISNSNVVTTIATNITTSSATVNGYITNSKYYNSNVYFEYGTSVNLGLRTATKGANGNSSFNEYISGLNPFTIYYFRAVSTDGSKGKIEIFRTLNTGAVAQRVIVQGTTVVGTSSPIMLKIENRYQSVAIGDVIDYTVTYKNISKKTLTNPILQVVLPKDITLTNSSSGTYSVDTNILTVDLKDLIAGEEGTVYVQGKVESLPANSAQVVTTAILVYTNSNTAQENAMAYVLNNPKDGNSLGASAFFAGLSGIGLIGWLLIIVLILALVLVARSLTHRPAQATSNIAH